MHYIGYDRTVRRSSVVWRWRYWIIACLLALSGLPAVPGLIRQLGALRRDWRYAQLLDVRLPPALVFDLKVRKDGVVAVATGRRVPEWEFFCSHDPELGWLPFGPAALQASRQTGWLGGTFEGTVYMGRRTIANQECLVVVDAFLLPLKTPQQILCLVTAVLGKRGWHVAVLKLSHLSPPRFLLDPGDQLCIFRGSAVPDHANEFTIPYELDGAKDVLRGRVAADGTVSLAPTSLSVDKFNFIIPNRNVPGPAAGCSSRN